MNFPIDESYARVGLNLFIEFNASEKAKPHVLNLATASAEKLKYFNKFIAPHDMNSFASQLNDFGNQIEGRRREISNIVQRAGGVDKLDPGSSQLAMKLQGEMQQFEAKKDQLLSTCANAEMVSLFENEISMALSTAQTSVDLANAIKDEAFKKQIEALMAPYNIKGKEMPTTDKQVEAPKDSATRDSIKR
jgi:hypothetical protein